MTKNEMSVSPEIQDFVCELWTNRVSERMEKKYPCQMCGECCYQDIISFNVLDIDPVADYLHLSASDFIKKYLIRYEEQWFLKESDPCPFLSSEKKCSIYPVRPMICRKFPFRIRPFQEFIFKILRNGPKHFGYWNEIPEKCRCGANLKEKTFETIDEILNESQKKP